MRQPPDVRSPAPSWQRGTGPNGFSSAEHHSNKTVSPQKQESEVLTTRRRVISAPPTARAHGQIAVRSTSELIVCLNHNMRIMVLANIENDYIARLLRRAAR